MKTDDQATSSDKREKHIQKFWITDQYHFWVTNDGYTLEKETYEGSLGYVIKLHHKDNRPDPLEPTANKYAVLKIPKLTGATHRENAYIIELMSQEEVGAYEAYIRGHPEGLLAFYSPRNIFKQPTVIEGKDETVFAEGGIVLVNCEPGNLPRFCLVGKQSYYPEKIDEGESFLSHYEKLKILDKSNAIFIPRKQVAGKASQKEFFHQVEAKKTDPIGDTWYAYLPNTVYRWADGTFQEAVSLGSRKKWNERQQISFLQQICKGIETLHKHGFIHADIRPANIVFVEDPSDPQKYLLADYGSFTMMHANAPIVAHGDGNPVYGTVLQGEHTSVFYAPERTQGRERETANKAIIIHKNQKIYVALGWKQDEQMTPESIKTMLNTALEKPSVEDENPSGHFDSFETSEVETNGDQSPEDEYNEFGLDISSDNGSSEELRNYDNSSLRDLDRELRKDDLVRIQDYVFRIAETETVINNVRFLPCLPDEVKRIYQRHIATKLDDPRELPRELSVDRVVEMKQWSGATDIYSLGVILLYSLFRNIVRSEQADGSTDFRESAKYENTIEDRFQNMLSTLISPPYFRIIWPDVDAVCQVIKSNLKEMQEGNFADTHYSDPRPEISDDSSKKETLKQRCIEVINRITISVSGTRDLVEALNFNMAAFLFLMRFALACLHRRSHLGRLATDQKLAFLSENMPFCKDRVEDPRNADGNSAAELASKELSWIADVVRDPRLKSLILEPEERGDIYKYDVRPNASVREFLRFAHNDIDDAFTELNKYMRGALMKSPAVKTAYNTLKDAQKRIENYDKTNQE